MRVDVDVDVDRIIRQSDWKECVNLAAWRVSRGGMEWRETFYLVEDGKWGRRKSTRTLEVGVKTKRTERAVSIVLEDGASSAPKSLDL
jgi:hypothetical protein